MGEQMGMRAAMAAGAGIFSLSAILAGCGGDGSPNIGQPVDAVGTSPDAVPNNDANTQFETTTTTETPSDPEGVFGSGECVAVDDVVEYVLSYDNDPDQTYNLIYGQDVGCLEPSAVIEGVREEFIGIGYDRSTGVVEAAGDTDDIMGWGPDDVIVQAAEMCTMIAIDDANVTPKLALEYRAENFYGFTDASPLYGLARAAKVICENNVAVPSWSGGWAEVGA